MIKAIVIRLALILGVLASGQAAAYTMEQFQFDDPHRTEQFRTLLNELRCVVCQNETLSSSNADVAQIMREEIYRLAQEGKDDEEIKAHLVERYGDFVLYDPPFKASTLIIWLGPFALIALGVFVLMRTLVNKKREPEPELSAEEHARLDELLQSPIDTKEKDQ